MKKYLILLALLPLVACEKKPCYYCTTSKVSFQSEDMLNHIPGTDKSESSDHKYCKKSEAEIHSMVTEGTHTDTVKNAAGVYEITVHSLMCQKR